METPPWCLLLCFYVWFSCASVVAVVAEVAVAVLPSAAVLPIFFAVPLLLVEPSLQPGIS